MRLAQALALYCGPGHRGSFDGAVALLRWFDVFAVFASESWLDWLPTKGLPSLSLLIELNSPLQCVCACLGTNKLDRRNRPPGGTILSHWGAEEEV